MSREHLVIQFLKVRLAENFPELAFGEDRKTLNKLFYLDAAKEAWQKEANALIETLLDEIRGIEKNLFSQVMLHPILTSLVQEQQDFMSNANDDAADKLSSQISSLQLFCTTAARSSSSWQKYASQEFLTQHPASKYNITQPESLNEWCQSFIEFLSKKFRGDYPTNYFVNSSTTTTLIGGQASSSFPSSADQKDFLEFAHHFRIGETGNFLATSAPIEPAKEASSATNKTATLKAWFALLARHKIEHIIGLGFGKARINYCENYTDGNFSVTAKTDATTGIIHLTISDVNNNGAAVTQTLRYYHTPVEDNHPLVADTFSDLEQLITLLQQRNIGAHCDSGVGRTGAFYVLANTLLSQDKEFQKQCNDLIDSILQDEANINNSNTQKFLKAILNKMAVILKEARKIRYCVQEPDQLAQLPSLFLQLAYAMRQAQCGTDLDYAGTNKVRKFFGIDPLVTTRAVTELDSVATAESGSSSVRSSVRLGSPSRPGSASSTTSALFPCPGPSVPRSDALSIRSPSNSTSGAPTPTPLVVPYNSGTASRSDSPGMQPHH